MHVIIACYYIFSIRFGCWEVIISDQGRECVNNQMVMFTLVMVIVRFKKVRTLQWKDLLVLMSGIQMK